MKLKIKKINRGLLLGAVLIIVMIFVIIADNRRFKKEKTDIEKTISDYASELSQWSVTPQKYQNSSVNYSPEDKQKLISGFSDFTDKYWTSADSMPLNFYGNEIGDFRNSIKELVNDEYEDYITDMSMSVRNIKVGQDGPNGAKVNCTIDIIVSGTSECAYISPGGYDNVYNEGNGLYKSNIESECTFYLERVSGMWKITGCESYGWNSQSVLLSDGEESGEEASE
ncbi:MAG: hypothetical protein ACI4JE_04365 [Ruminococcus sp.]